MFPILPCKTIFISSSFNHYIFIHILISVLFQNCILFYHIFCQFATNLQNNNCRFLCPSYIFKLLVCHFFCGQFNTCHPFLLPAPAFALVWLFPLYLLSTSRAILWYARAGDVFNAAHRTVFSGQRCPPLRGCDM